MRRCLAPPIKMVKVAELKAMPCDRETPPGATRFFHSTRVRQAGKVDRIAEHVRPALICIERHQTAPLMARAGRGRSRQHNPAIRYRPSGVVSTRAEIPALKVMVLSPPKRLRKFGHLVASSNST
jgi:hypothetical protein